MQRVALSTFCLLLCAALLPGTAAAPVDLRKAFVDYLKTHNATKDAKGQYPRQGILTYDGVHLSARGNELVADLIAQGICEALGRQTER